jgi:hypothetical protein
MCHLLYDFVRVHRSHSRQIPKYHSTKSLANAIWIMNRLQERRGPVSQSSKRVPLFVIEGSSFHTWCGTDQRHLCQCVERAEDWTPAQTKVCGTDWESYRFYGLDGVSYRVIIKEVNTYEGAVDRDSTITVLLVILFVNSVCSA